MSTWIQQLVGFITVLTMGYAGYANIAPGGQVGYPTQTPQMWAQTSTGSATSTTSSDPAAMCASAGGTWSPSATPPCVMPGSSGSTTSSSSTASSTTTGSSACTSTQYWNGTACVAMETPPPTPTSTTPASSCGSGFYWNGSSCVANPTSTMSTSCPAGQEWRQTACVVTSSPAPATSSTTNTWTAPTAASCAAQNMNYCTPTSGGSGWCSSSECPPSTPAACTAKGWAWCADSTGFSSGGCMMSAGPCPNSTPTPMPSAPTSCPQPSWPEGKYLCTSSGSYASTYCSSNPCTQSQCSAAGKKWCDPAPMPAGSMASSSTLQGWCTDSTCPTTSTPTPTPVPTPTPTPMPVPPPTPVPPTPPTPTTPPPPPSPTTCPQAGQSADMKYKCTSSGPYASGSPWCSTMPCAQSECTGSEFEWCDPAPTTSTTAMYTPQGWCSRKSNGSGCPVYTEPACKAKAGDWCQGSGGGMGWCATNGATCPNENKDKQDCVARGDEWCLPMGGGGYGWCAGKTSGGCPARTQTECSEKQGKWCKNAPMPAGMAIPATMQDGYCVTGSYAECPIYAKADCTTAGRQWCVNTSTSYSASPMSMNGMDNGWCASKGSTCPPGQEPKPEPKPSPCPVAMYMPCPPDTKEEAYTNAQGCTMQRCVKKGGPEPVPCPAIAPPTCANNEEVVWKYESGSYGSSSCPRAECRPRKETCAPPPPDNQCPGGWIAQYYGIPAYGDARALTINTCPWYECKNTEHDRTEECVKKAVGETSYALMKSGRLSDAAMRELMPKMQPCFGVVPPPPPPPGPEPEPRPVPVCNLPSMKRDMDRELQRVLRDMDAAVEKFRKAGITVPVIYEALLTKIKTLAEQAAKTSNCDGLFTIGRDLPELMQQLQEQLLGIEHIARVGEAVKRLDGEFKALERTWARTLRTLQGVTKQQLHQEFKDAAALFKSLVEAVKASAQSADPDKIETATRQAFEALDVVRSTMQTGDILVNSVKILRAVRREIRNAASLAKELKEDEEDVSELEELIQEMSSLVKEADTKRVACSRKQDASCLVLFKRFMETRQDLEFLVNDFNGVGEDVAYYNFLGVGKLGQGLETFEKTKTFEFFAL